MDSTSNSGKYIVGSIIAVILCCYLLNTCSNTDNTPTPRTSNTSTSRNITKPSTPEINLPSPPSQNIPNPEPAYTDPLWPTNSTELSAIPESDRWYNAQAKIGTNGTIAGPVISVTQATDSQGMPVFINIGNDYPSAFRVQIVIWGDRVSEFEDMLNQIDHGNAWVSVTGYIGEYGGVPQIDVNDGYTEWRWWTQVTK